MAGDFFAVAGSVVTLDGQRDAEITLSLMPDTVPELEELYIVSLTSVEGGATLDGNPYLIKTQIRYVILFFQQNIRFSLTENEEKKTLSASTPGCEQMTSLTASSP